MFREKIENHMIDEKESISTVELANGELIGLGAVEITTVPHLLSAKRIIAEGFPRK